MKTNITSKFHLIVIITCIAIAIGAAVGTICHFVAGGFFNYGVEYASTKSVSVTYYVTDYSAKEVKEICEEQLSSVGAYTLTESESNAMMEYTFSASVDAEKLADAVKAINTKLSEGEGINLASVHENEALVSNVNVYVWCGVAIASIVVLQALYLLIRYKLFMALTNLITNAVSFILFVALLAATHLPIGSYIAPVVLVGTLITMICSQLYFAKARAMLKAEDADKLVFEQVCEDAAKASFMNIAVFCGVILVCSLIIAGVLAITGAIAYSAIAVAVALAAVVSWWISAVATPAVYSRLKSAKKN